MSIHENCASRSRGNIYFEALLWNQFHFRWSLTNMFLIHCKVKTDKVTVNNLHRNLSFIMLRFLKGEVEEVFIQDKVNINTLPKTSKILKHEEEIKAIEVRGWMRWGPTLIDIKSRPPEPVTRAPRQWTSQGQSFARLILPKPRISGTGGRHEAFLSIRVISFELNTIPTSQLSRSLYINVNAIFKVDFVVYKMSCCGWGGGKYCLGMKHKTLWIALQSVKLNT